MNNLSLSDEKLFMLCQKYGEQARKWRQRFIGLLPEVNRRRLYEKKGFASIFMFAKMLAGLSEEQVRLALNLEKRLEDKPVLQKMLVTGEVSINKLARVISIATIENEQELAEKMKLLSQKALETLVRDEKLAQHSIQKENLQNLEGENKNSSQEPLFDDKSLHKGCSAMRAQTSPPISSDKKSEPTNFQLDEDIIKELNELHAKGININDLLRTMLRQRHEQIAQTKEEISTNIQPAKSRHIPIKIKQLIKEEHGTKCSIATCFKPAQHIHHTQRFGLSQNHDPHYLAPLCKEHHQIAHSIDLKYRNIKFVRIPDSS